MNSNYTRYVSSSAAYCEKLFRVAELFFSANRLIEHPIGQNAAATKEDLEAITLKFNACSDAAQEAKSKLETYREVHNSYPSDTMISVDFSAQINRLVRFEATTRSLSHAFGSFAPGCDLQRAIWAEPEITTQSIDGASLVCEMISWQCAFAHAAHAT